MIGEEYAFYLNHGEGEVKCETTFEFLPKLDDLQLKSA